MPTEPTGRVFIAASLDGFIARVFGNLEHLGTRTFPSGLVSSRCRGVDRPGQ